MSVLRVPPEIGVSGGLIGGVAGGVIVLFVLLVVGFVVNKRNLEKKQRKLLEDYSSQLQMVSRTVHSGRSVVQGSSIPTSALAGPAVLPSLTADPMT